MYTHFNADLKKRPTGTILAILSGFIGTFGMIISSATNNVLFGRISLIVMMGFFTLLITLPAFIIHNHRLKKIINELGITVEQYNAYVKMFIE